MWYWEMTATLPETALVPSSFLAGSNFYRPHSLNCAEVVTLIVWLGSANATSVLSRLPQKSFSLIDQQKWKFKIDRFKPHLDYLSPEQPKWKPCERFDAPVPLNFQPDCQEFESTFEKNKTRRPKFGFPTGLFFSNRESLVSKKREKNREEATRQRSWRSIKLGQPFFIFNVNYWRKKIGLKKHFFHLNGFFDDYFLLPPIDERRPNQNLTHWLRSWVWLTVTIIQRNLDLKSRLPCTSLKQKNYLNKLENYKASKLLNDHS